MHNDIADGACFRVSTTIGTRSSIRTAARRRNHRSRLGFDNVMPFLLYSQSYPELLGEGDHVLLGFQINPPSGCLQIERWEETGAE